VPTSVATAAALHRIVHIPL